MKNLTEEEAAFLLSDETLTAWAPYSIPLRCVLFNRKFTERRMKPWVLGGIMKKAGLKKKQVVIVKAPLRRTARLDVFDEKSLLLDVRVNELL